MIFLLFFSALLLYFYGVLTHCPPLRRRKLDQDKKGRVQVTLRPALFYPRFPAQ